MRILIDLDGIVADLLGPWLSLYNFCHGDKLTVEDITEWDIHKVVKPSCDHKIYEYLQPPYLDFAELKPLPGAVAGVKALQEADHEVVICTASAKHPETASAKLYWIREHLDIDRKHVFIGHQKHWIQADVFIDDSPVNIEAYCLAWPRRCSILTIAYPYNKCVEQLVDLRAPEWDDTERAWDLIVNYCVEKSL